MCFCINQIELEGSGVLSLLFSISIYQMSHKSLSLNWMSHISEMLKKKIVLAYEQCFAQTWPLMPLYQAR